MRSSDTLTMRKLSLVKGLFDRAVTDAQYVHVLSNRTMAIIGLDLAVETILKITSATLSPTGKNQTEFQALLQSVEIILSAEGFSIQYKAGILHQHSIRNDAQHKGRYPNEIDLFECISTTRSFCSDLLKFVWDLNFEDLSLVDSISDPNLRFCLEQSRVAIASENFQKSLSLSGLALTLGSKCLQSLIPRTAYGVSSSVFNMRADFNISDINRALRDAENNAKRYAALLATSISPVEYHRFLSSLPSSAFEIVAGTEEKPQHWILHFYDRDRTFNCEEADWGLHFVINSIINWQNMGILDTLEADQDRDRIEMIVRWQEDEVLFD